MGSGPSKPAPSSTQHVFSSETPVRFSQDLVNALQASPETDSTRAKDLELHIQSRVTAELARLDAETTQELTDLEARISSTPDSTTESTNTPSTTIPDQTSSSGGPDHKAKAEGDRTRDLSRVKVQEEIEKLKSKLKERQLKEDIMKDTEVNKAKEKVVACLRLNDRRPLDCWKEVETFRREVGRLEGAFLGRVLE
ncbi:hypothetical protein HO173_008686 [Letharia columbiana]|uniref:Altered inheritance of mitochondria protein 13, mitochondrial n=1 Tax=Letharia columbiana TaxID=112416 RepID=A0A8H6L2I9_9LECA|nr:uncharacterized protein HO173_008686 [Letharia columbiana]KAF6233142.1 hypothetical protein HO173_008686 [Letharia columbiana]